jgi:hypothetical protein
MPRVLPHHIATAFQQVEPLTPMKGEKFADAVFAQQPNLLGSLLVLPRLGVSHEQLDVALKILFLCFEAVRATGVTIRTITEDDQERCLARLVGKMQFMEGLDQFSASAVASDQMLAHSEPNLFALAYGVLKENRLVSVRTEAEKHLLLAAFNLVETLSGALDDA